MATKKSPQKNKSSSTRKTSTQTTQAAHTKPQFSEAANRQMWAVFVFAFGILFASMTLIKGQKVWLFFHNFVLGMFGWSAFLIAPIFFYIAIMATLDKPLGSIKHKLWQTFLLVGFISGAVQVFGSGIPIIDGLWNKVKCLFRDGIALEGGGVVSGVFGLPFLNWFGATGAKITMILLIFVSFMVLSGGTLIGLYHSAKKPVKKLEEVYTEKAAQRAEQPKRKPFNIDIPMDEDVKSDEFISPMGEEETIPIPAKQIESKKKRTAAEASESISSLMKKEILPMPPSEQEAVTVEPVQDDIIPIPEETFEPVPMLDDIIGKLLDGEHFEDNDEGAVKTENISDEMLNGIMAEPFDRLSEAMVKEEEKPETYNYPPLDILQEPKPVSGDNITEELKGTAEKLVSTLKSFGVETRIIDIARGPAVTRYELQPSVGVKISKITGLADDIALNLAASGVRIEAPIPNKAAVGIEIPNRIVSSVSIREILDTPEF
ncbi:MAG: DNA translocase FtsK, partial [Oscillospiraceae bacterium]